LATLKEITGRSTALISSMFLRVLAEGRHVVTQPKQVRLAGSMFDRARHVCAFFHSKEEEYHVLLPFIRDGLDEGDRALHIIDPRNRDDHVRRLEQVGIDVAEAQSREQLEIRSWEDAYLKEGSFDQHRQIALIERWLAAGKAHGFPMTRLVANMSWAMEDWPGVNNILEYESRLNDVLPKYHDAVCCTYDLSRFSASVIMDALRVHPAVIIGGILQVNPFYVPPDVFLRELEERRVLENASAS